MLLWSFFLFFSFSRTVLRALPLCLLVCRAELRAAPSCWGLGTLLLQTHRLQLETNSVSASFSSLQHDLRLLPLGRSKYSIHFFFFFNGQEQKNSVQVHSDHVHCEAGPELLSLVFSSSATGIMQVLCLQIYVKDR